MLRPNRILIATTNLGKRAEIQTMAAELADSSLPLEWLIPADVDLSNLEVEETGDTYLANALLKARAYAEKSALPALADDSGIEVDALGGKPGVYSARYGPTAAERNAKLLAALSDIPADRRTARFRCVIAVVLPGGLTLLGEGTLEGKVALVPRGTNGHGYDPILELADGRTVAELGPTEKNMLSHRAQAFRAVFPALHCVLKMG